MAATSHPGPHRAAAPPGRRRAGRWLAGAALAVPTAVLLCRLAGVDGVTPVPQLLAFLPHLLVAAAAGLALCVLVRWRAGLVWSLAVALGIGALLPSYGRAEAAPAGPPAARLSVLTANLRLGAATDALVEVLRSEHPDLVFVQECDLACGERLETAELTRLYPHRVLAAATGAEGSAILSRHPVRPAGEVPGLLAMPGAEAVVEGVPVALLLAHPLPPIPGMVADWRRELTALRTAAADLDGAAIVAGDFNATRDHAAFRAVLDTGLRDSAPAVGLGREPSWTAAPLAGAQIDHILVGGPLHPTAGRFLDLAGSDHRALLVEADLYAGG
ncbi:endonuclease/exonuclease/phosphatase family protein [Marinitenerispora sediminis]|uniref:Endonuclease/exonuclease/phosphatase domain-containing protein n=1 Tax=Marinitenerispora sediminis TaxID=1931232 RepID=A0A368T9E5_9ACTN|nr:endonuclease/exonuclease/phosphatase family protein [Marinitenerispora sediminis]RCV51107.1 hypothetical protein DEF23_21065 [Marinitenerispora sediminis]RCV54617.1 hypothetical protein DEF28_07975 [Marinitenerispora sediminis]RCV61155.1 hypothetical protein DEF24_04800 [Marinitenerispora sediminis]